MKSAVFLLLSILVGIPGKNALLASGVPLPLGAFTLTSANAGCSGSIPQITLNWTTASGVASYEIYRNGVLYVPDVPANGLSFPDPGGRVAAGSTYPYFIRAKSDTETRDSGSLQATAPASCGDPLAPASFTLTTATPSCNDTTPQITLRWTTSDGAASYDIYRNGILSFSGIPPAGRMFVNSG